MSHFKSSVASRAKMSCTNASAIDVSRAMLGSSEIGWSFSSKNPCLLQCLSITWISIRVGETLRETRREQSNICSKCELLDDYDGVSGVLNVRRSGVKLR